MPEKIHGIVLDSIRFKENSNICKIYSKEFGLISIVVNGVGSGKNKLSSIYFQPLTCIELVAYIKDRKSIFKAKDIVILSSPFGPIPDIIRNSISVFISEIVLRTAKEFEPDESIYNLLVNTTLNVGERNLNISSLHLFFLFSYIEILGFSFRDEIEKSLLLNKEMDPELYSKLTELATLNTYSNIELSKKVRSKLLNFLLDYLGEHSGLFNIKSLRILEEIMS